MQQSRTGSRKIAGYCFWLIVEPGSLEAALPRENRESRQECAFQRARAVLPAASAVATYGSGQQFAEAGLRSYRAAVTMISTLYLGAASLTSTVARAGVFPGETQASHTPFISAKVFMSVR
jgi:hypothetical protein